MEPSKIEEKKGVWQTPKRKKIQSRVLARTPNVRGSVSVSKNQVSPLAGHGGDEAPGEAQPRKEERPQPIFIKNLININAPLTETRNLDPGENYHTCSQNLRKLNFQTVEGYRKVIKYLDTTTVEYHTIYMTLA